MEPGDPVAVLTDGRVTLRPHREADIPDMVLMCRDPQMIRWTTVPDPYDEGDARAYLTQTHENRRAGTPVTWAIEVDGRFSGNIDLRLDGARGAEIGYALAPWARSQGVLSRSLRLLLPRAFPQLGLDVVRWRAEVGNWASRRVAWAVGFTVEGRQRGLLPARGAATGEAPRDAWVGSLWRHDPLRPNHPWFTPPLIRERGFVLRPHVPQDAPRIAESCADPLSQRFLPFLPEPYGIAEARAFLDAVAEQHASGTELSWAVADPAGEELLGTVSVAGMRSRLSGGIRPTAEIGYWMHPAARGRGLMVAAVRAVARHALLPAEDGGLGLRALRLRASVDNPASQRVAEHAGFHRGGLHRAEQLDRDGGTSDLVYFDLVPGELPAAED